MLSAETAAGQYPYEAVNIMDRIVARVEQDEGWRHITDASRPDPEGSSADAIATARPAGGPYDLRAVDRGLHRTAA